MFLSFIELINQKLFYPFGAIFAISVFLTFKSGFVQLRTIGQMWKLLTCRTIGQKTSANESEVSPVAALFIAMSTAIGLGNIIGPVVAVSMAGPWALVGFLVSAIFGSVLTFCEVVLSLKFRNYSQTHLVPGPMAYIKPLLGNWYAKMYSFLGLLLLTAWSTSQAGSLSEVASFFAIPKIFSACFITALVFITLFGGVGLVGWLSAQMVPWMLSLYLLGTGTVIVINFGKIPALLAAMFCSPVCLKSIGIGFAIQQAVRWGFAKGVTATESGVGTSAFAHSTASGDNPYNQGVLSIFGVFVTTFICMLSGLSFLLSCNWQDLGNKIDLYIFLDMFSKYFSSAGPIIFFGAVFLFAFGTILGNCFNATQCFKYLFGAKHLWAYYSFYALAIFAGSLTDIQFLWASVDFFVVPVAFVNIFAIVIAVNRSMIDWDKKS